MAQKFRPKSATGSIIRNITARFVGVLVIATTSFTAMTGDAFGPAYEGQSPIAHPAAGVIFSGSGPIITGSVSRLFNSPVFVGPNRALKTSRLRNKVSVIEFVRSFAQARLKLARLQASEPVDIPALPRYSLSDAVGAPAKQQEPPISMAAVDPALASAALAAIVKATPVDPLIPPRPSVISSRLAYARANAPSSERVVNRYSGRERRCMSTAIYFEARGESYRGQVAVAQVIMNRVKLSLYPDTICGVVFQNQSRRDRCQFSFACDGIPERVTDRKAWARAQEITQKVTTGKIYLSDVANATHYHANYVHPDWARRMKRVATIGSHIFYRFRG